MARSATSQGAADSAAPSGIEAPIRRWTRTYTRSNVTPGWHGSTFACVKRGVDVGDFGEYIAMRLARHQGFTAKRQKRGHVFDLLVDGDRRVEVKTATRAPGKGFTWNHLLGGGYDEAWLLGIEPNLIRWWTVPHNDLAPYITRAPTRRHGREQALVRGKADFLVDFQILVTERAYP